MHGEQYIELHKPLSTEGKLLTKIHISDVLDKGKNALIVIDGMFFYVFIVLFNINNLHFMFIFILIFVHNMNYV